MPRCPFAPRGMGSDLLAACPGFEPDDVRLVDGPGAGLQGITCAHIGRETTIRGFVAQCMHPDAEHIVEAAVRLSLAVPAGRRRDR